MDHYSINSPDKLWYAEISANFGANVTKLQYKGRDVFVPLDSKKQQKEEPFIHGCPILLPANRTYKGRFCFEGKEYSLPLNDLKNNAHLHGVVHLSEFVVVKNSNDQLELEYLNDGSCYPFVFKISVKYTVKNDGFYQQYRIENTGNRNMPFTFALHTTFVEPETFSAPLSLCQQKDDHHIPTGKYVPLNLTEQKYVSGSRSQGLNISGYYKSSGNTAEIGDFRYTVSKNFDHWILFNGGGNKNFLCVEPQCGAVNGLNIDGGHTVLKPGEFEVFSTTVKTV